MSNSRYHDTRDAVEAGLIAVAYQVGANWYRAPPLDGWVWYRGRWMPVEVKDPKREGQADEYTPLQLRFFSWCRLVGAKWLIWRTSEDVVRTLGEIR